MRKDENMAALNRFCQLRLIDLVKLLWTGSVKASLKNKYVAIMYAGLVVVTVLVGLASQKWGFMILLILLVALVLGIWEYIKGLPLKRKRQFFNDVFVAMDFKASDCLYPFFLCETAISEYTLAFSFDTLIPLTKWLSRKEELEMYFGEKIVEISQGLTDNRIMNIFIQLNPLPEYLEWTDERMAQNDVLNIGISHMDIVGINLEQHPHAFIAGETGSGKSNILKCLIHQALQKNYEAVLIDFKRGVSFTAFEDRVAIYYDYPEVIKVLNEMVEETKSRLDKFRNAKVDNLNDYNQVAHEYLHRKIVFIDELAELLKTRDKETANALNDSIETLTRLSRAVGIHLIMGIQRPDSTVVSGQIKNNVSFRVCGRFVDREPSRIMLSSDVASSLPNIKGRFIVKANSLFEVQSFYFANVAPSFQRATPVLQPQPISSVPDNGYMEVLTAMEVVTTTTETTTAEYIGSDMDGLDLDNMDNGEPEPTASHEESTSADSFDFDFSNFRSGD